MTQAHDHADHTGHDGHGHGHGHDGHALHEHNTDAGMDELLDLDAEVLRDYWAAALDWVRDAAVSLSPARLLDLGAGTGTGALGLAQRFPDATVAALDISAEALRKLRDKAAGRGLAARVNAVEADLDAGWPDLGTLDLTWASMSLHHMADPAAVLGDVLAATRPGGLIAVAEFSEPLRFLSADLGDLGRGGADFEDRMMTRLGAAHAEQMPTLGSAWAPRLTEAGWHVTAERDFPIDLNPPSDPQAPAYARAWFNRLSHGLDGQLEPDDQATLADLLDDDGPHSLLRQANLHIRGTRTVTVARRD
ncbi:MAG TPA: class I SAM-dependent methyltransferase [Trebonia sp.]